MDKYDEKAKEIAGRNDISKGAQEVLADWIAAFGRECAAQAYEDAAKHIRKEYNSGGPSLSVHYCGWLTERAAALRSVKP